jgi:hypothetical protein
VPGSIPPALAADARRREGQTSFDIIEIIRSHGPGGADATDLVLLDLIED